MAMTLRERMLAFVQGREMDRVPFCEYSTICGDSNETVWELVGRENMGLLAGVHAHRIEHPNCQFENEEYEFQGNRAFRATLHTPAGDLVQEAVQEPTFGTCTRRKSFVREPKDYEVLRSYLKDITIYPYTEGLENVLKGLGEDGIPHTWLGRTPFQQMWIEWVRMEDFSVHLVDCEDIVQECMNLAGEVMRQMFHAVKDAPAPYFVFGDNITAPLIGERYFRQYCVPYYNELADILSDRGIPVFVHMDGDLKPLWKAISESKVGGLDSYSPTPDNDTSPADAITNMPNVKLGMNFPSSVHLASPEEIYRTTWDILQQAGHSGRLQIQISENPPPGAWKKSYPEIVRAINDFGKP